MWGGVGCGKIYFMDIFFEVLLIEKKFRVYFYCFMYWVYDELCILLDVSDLFEIVVDCFCVEVNIICFDEFFVLDIIDVMIFGILFEVLFRCGIVLVVILNIVFKDLYCNGL